MNRRDNQTYDYFSQRDFDRCDPPCQMSDMDHDFMNKLDKARRISNIPYQPTSAFRTKEHELEQGRDGSSSHTKGLAIDLQAKYSRQRFLILKGLIESGFTRIGIDTKRGFIHVDSDTGKSQKVVWGYDE
jgi:hypothetical protein